MDIDLYHLYRSFHFSKMAYPIVLDVLKVWAEASGWRARVSICKESAVDLATDAVAVGISVYSQTAPAAYRVADALRRRGKIVVLGGPHFRGPSTWAEAAPHCDVIVGSVCEAQWRALLDDIAAGRLRPNRPEPLHVTDTAGAFRYPADFYQSLASRRWYQIPTIPTSIGCPYDCDFCAAFMQGKYLLRDVRTIVNEVAHATPRMVIMCDATFGLNKKFTIELMRALAPLEKKIAVEITIGRLKDREVLDALALGGVKWLVVGVETLSTPLRKHGTVDLDDGFRRVLDAAHERGMVIQGNFICGLDSDGPDSFETIYDYYDRSGLDGIMMGILTPYPDTDLYRRLRREGRIFDTDWEHYDCHHVVYRPQRMTVDELIDGYIQLYRMVRRRRSVLGEIVANWRRSGISIESGVVIANNVYQKFDSVKKTRLLRENQRALAASSASTPAGVGVVAAAGA
ncbi:MAG TPA: B12-binding domain-containing radical SAM protein [Candidatus Binatia bacterium]|nr:B12-binding domain-containing radical SAM protein [Candidatus Binatia bacterium]